MESRIARESSTKNAVSWFSNQGYASEVVVLGLNSHVNIKTILRLDRIQEIRQNVAKKNKNSEYRNKQNKYRQTQNPYTLPFFTLGN